MIQISYQPAFDPFHAVFRICRLWDIITVRRIEKDKIRILDFYLLFPFRAHDIKFTRGHTKYRRLAETYVWKKPYGEQPDDQTIFSRMEPMQTAALDTLAIQGHLDVDQLELNWVALGDQPLPDDITTRVQEANRKEADLMAFLSVLSSEYSLLGEGGLKARTGLLEYRYDAV